MSINEDKLKELLHGIRLTLGTVMNFGEKEMKSAADMIEKVFEPENKEQC